MKPSDLITGKSAGAGIAKLLGQQPKAKTREPSCRPVTGTLALVLPPGVLAEYRFHGERAWRFDFAWPQYQVALEIEGGVWTQGRHTRGAGFVADMSKYNTAAEAGWLVIRKTPQELESGDAGAAVERAIAERGRA